MGRSRFANCAWDGLGCWLAVVVCPHQAKKCCCRLIMVVVECSRFMVLLIKCLSTLKTGSSHRERVANSAGWLAAVAMHRARGQTLINFSFSVWCGYLIWLVCWMGDLLGRPLGNIIVII